MAGLQAALQKAEQDLAQQESGLEQEVLALRETAAQSESSADTIAALQDEVAGLQAALQKAEQDFAQQQSGLEQEVLALRETSTQSVSSADTIAALQDEVAGLQAALQKAEQDFAQLQASTVACGTDDTTLPHGVPVSTEAAYQSILASHSEVIAGLNRLLGGQHAPGAGNSVVHLMLDNIAGIRDEIGIMHSEQLISEVAGVIASLCDGDDVLSRAGDNTFVLLCGNEEYKASQEKAEQIRSTIENRVFNCSGQSLTTTASIGICSVRDNDRNAADVIARAELASQMARSSGGNQVLASSAMADQMAVLDNKENNAELVTKTLEENRIRIYYQPITSLKSQHGSHFEVLIRVMDESGNLILPGEFFSMAEKTGHAVDIDLHVMEGIMRMMAENRSMDMTLFIKLTRQSVADHDVPVWILDKLNEYRINPEQLVFEVAENILQSDLKNLSMLSKALQAIGCKVAIEHYSMSTPPQLLQQVRADYLKIDSSLVGSVGSKGGNLSRVREIVDLARKHDLITIAENVESPACLAILWELGVSLAQGYFIQAPTGDLHYDFQDIVSESESGDNRKATFTIS